MLNSLRCGRGDANCCGAGVDAKNIIVVAVVAPAMGTIIKSKATQQQQRQIKSQATQNKAKQTQQQSKGKANQKQCATVRAETTPTILKC